MKLTLAFWVSKIYFWLKPALKDLEKILIYKYLCMMRKEVLKAVIETMEKYVYTWYVFVSLKYLFFNEHFSIQKCWCNYHK